MFKGNILKIYENFVMFGRTKLTMLVLHKNSRDGIMDKLTSIVSQYNNSEHNEKVLKNLQASFKQDGTKIIKLNAKQFIIQ